MDKVRFVTPVKIGDTLYMEMETIEAKPKDDQRGVITTESHIVNQRGEDCCVYIAKMLCGRRPVP